MLAKCVPISKNHRVRVRYDLPDSYKSGQLNFAFPGFDPSLIFRTTEYVDEEPVSEVFHWPINIADGGEFWDVGINWVLEAKRPGLKTRFVASKICVYSDHDNLRLLYLKEFTSVGDIPEARKVKEIKEVKEAKGSEVKEKGSEKDTEKEKKGSEKDTEKEKKGEPACKNTDSKNTDSKNADSKSVDNPKAPKSAKPPPVEAPPKPLPLKETPTARAAELRAARNRILAEQEP